MINLSLDKLIRAIIIALTDWKDQRKYTLKKIYRKKDKFEVIAKKIIKLLTNFKQRLKEESD